MSASEKEKPTIVAITAGDDRELGPLAEAAGADEVIHKADVHDFLLSLAGRIIAVIDDYPIVLKATAALLGPQNTVHTFKTAEDALEQIPNLEPPVDLIITDLNLGEKRKSGIDFIREYLAQHFPQPPKT